MLDTPVLARLREKAAGDFQAWYKEHVEPILVYMHAESDRAPLNDVELGSVLDKAISPLVYWVRDNPLFVGSASQSEPVPAAKASSSPENPMGGGSLSNWPSREFQDEHGLMKSSHREALGFDCYVLEKFLGPKYREVDALFKEHGFTSHQDVGEHGRNIRYWEKRVPQ